MILFTHEIPIRYMRDEVFKVHAEKRTTGNAKDY